MKATIIFVLMGTATSMVFGGSFLNEKEDAKNAVVLKYKEAESLISKINNDIVNEKKKREENAEQQAKNTLELKIKETEDRLAQCVRDSTRTAIAKGKPIQAIECIGTVYGEGEKMIGQSKESLKNEIDSVLQDKHKKLDFLEIQCKFISEGLADLKDQALKKIDSLQNGFESVKVDASKKVESAKKQLNEIENQTNTPLLQNKYSSVRKMIENKCQDITGILLKKLQKCVA